MQVTSYMAHKKKQDSDIRKACICLQLKTQVTLSFETKFLSAWIRIEPKTQEFIKQVPFIEAIEVGITFQKKGLNKDILG